MGKGTFNLDTSSDLDLEDFLCAGGAFGKQKAPNLISPQKLQANSVMQREAWNQRWTTIGLRLLRSTRENIEKYVYEQNQTRPHPLTISDVVRQMLEEKFGA